MFRAAAAVPGPAGEICRSVLFLGALWIACLLFRLQTEANLLSLLEPFFSSPAFFLFLAASSRDFFRTGKALFRLGRHDGPSTRDMIFFHPPRGVMEMERAVFIREHREYKIEVLEKQLHWQWARAILHEMIFWSDLLCRGFRYEYRKRLPKRSEGLWASTGKPAGRGALSVCVSRPGATPGSCSCIPPCCLKG